MPRLALVYDADCGPCTRFKHLVDFIDARNQIEFVPLIEADETGLLDKIPKSIRHASFHLVFPDGDALSGSAAIPTLIGILPLGKVISKVITSSPGGSQSISFVYEVLSRLHDRGSCSYPRRSSPGSWVGFPAEGVSKGLLSPSPKRSRFLYAGFLGGFLGSLAMGSIVPLPDSLCLWLATVVAGQGPSMLPLAWAFHIATGVIIGGGLGIFASFTRIRGRKPMYRSILLGLSTGLFVWAGFFTPSMMTFLPSLITNALLEKSLAAHVAFGLVLGATLGVTLSRSFGKNKRAMLRGLNGPVGNVKHATIGLPSVGLQIPHGATQTDGVSDGK